MQNIKKFGPDGKIFKFSKHAKIYTISGVNGSGKTAIFKSIQLFQKLFFIDQYEDEEILKRYYNKTKEECFRLMSSNNAVIDIVFDIDDNQQQIELNLENNNGSLYYYFESKTPEAYAELLKIWNADDPKDIIAIIDAGKSFSGFGVEFGNIKIKSKADALNDYLLQAIFEPENILKNIYEKTVIDHIQYRLDPSRKYDYFKIANKSIKQIIDTIEVSNISATKVDGEIVILGKSSKETSPFDIKDFSAGERAIYLTLLFIFNFPKLGILVIDEPENHLHDSILGKFYNLLLNITASENINQWARKFEKDSQLICGDNIKQTFLITHSRSLIYSNINYGECLVFNKNNLEPTSNTSIEAELRSAGISTILTKTLFIEGNSDLSLIESYFIQKGIKVVALGSCTEVIEYFKRISSIKNSIHGAAFCFAIDHDNRIVEDIQSIKNIDEDFFEQSFIVLDRHEIENYLIDPKLLLDCINPIKKAMGEKQLSTNEIKSIFRSESIELKNQSMAKYIASGLSIATKELITNKITNTKTISKNLSGLIYENITEDTIIELEARKIFLRDEFETNWSKNWESLVDGKAFLGKVINKIATNLGIKSDKIRNMIHTKISDDLTQYKINDLITSIMIKMNKQIND